MTRPIGGAPAGGGGAPPPAYTDAQAVAAVNVYRNWHGAVQAVPLPLAGPTLVLFATLAWTVPEVGVYGFQNSVLATATSANAQFQAEIRVDGVPQGGPLFAFGVAGGVQTFAALPFSMPLSVGPHVTEIYVAQPTSPGTTTALGAFIQTERKQ
jgi:hypothetical protein